MSHHAPFCKQVAATDKKNTAKGILINNIIKKMYMKYLHFLILFIINLFYRAQSL